ncbi:hypothetical protein EUGRSUZ_C00687 [Eucalyptus grandis]|uniref:Uncharacterized protein n=2 Tax=Eucalyptus grandis TaxID=71139 RepID=A0ACC3LAL9_EUCGR|nr:hypothetical protein EUGRSUZ_C00687 [Eucalyptus grandis]
MESKLYEAAVEGNVRLLLELLRKDKLLLAGIMTGNHTKTPLHFAAMLGHLDFVEEQKDTLASLLRVNPEACLIHDKYKRNPLHVTAMKGHVDILECLVQVRPDAARSVVERCRDLFFSALSHGRLRRVMAC